MIFEFFEHCTKKVLLVAVEGASPCMKCIFLHPFSHRKFTLDIHATSQSPTQVRKRLAIDVPIAFSVFAFSGTGRQKFSFEWCLGGQCGTHAELHGGALAAGGRDRRGRRHGSPCASRRPQGAVHCH